MAEKEGIKLNRIWYHSVFSKEKTELNNPVKSAYLYYQEEHIKCQQ